MMPARRPLAGLLVIAALARAAEARAADDSEAILALYVNTVAAGEVHAVLHGNDVLVERSVLEQAGLSHFTATEQEIGGRRLVSLASVKPALRFTVDTQDVALRIDAPIALLPTHVIDLGNTPVVSYERKNSVFFNYSPSVRVSSNEAAVGTAFFESGVSEKNRLWYSGLSASTTDGFARGLTNVTFDDRPRMRRLTIGDANVSAGAIGGAAVLGGVTLAKDFSMNPYFIRFPSMRFASATDVPATLDVYVNGIRVRSQPIDPGTFTLDNVRGLVGSGRVTYIVRDALGRQQQFSSPYYVAPTVLAKGVDDYAMSIGFQRDRLGIASFDYETPAIISYYQRGISDRVTLGARAEARWERVSGGPYVATTTPIGVFALEGGASIASDDRGGVAGVASYAYLSPRLNVSASLRALSSDYSTATLTPEMDRSTCLASTTVSVPVTRKSSISTLFSLGVDRDLPNSASVGMLGQTQLTREFSLFGQVALVSTRTPASSLDALLTLSWVPRNDVYASAAVETTNKTPGFNMQVAKSATVGEGWSFTGAMNVSEETDVSMLHRLQTSANTISTYLDRTSSGAALTVNPAGSIVWVEGSGLALTRPVYDSFALVRVPNVKGVRVYLNSQEVGRTNAKGELVVPGLISYYGSQIKIAPEDVPLTYSLEHESAVIAPPRRGAGYVELAANRVHYVRGKLRLASEQGKVIPLFGDFAVDPGAKELVSPIGDDGTFELEGVSSGKHEAEIRFKGQVCRVSFVAPTSDAPVIDLGTLECLEAK